MRAGPATARQVAAAAPFPPAPAIKWSPEPVDDVVDGLQVITEAPMRFSTLTGALCLLAMLLLASPGVRLERSADAAAQPATAPLAAATH
jgi:hypothetical protein